MVAGEQLLMGCRVFSKHRHSLFTLQEIVNGSPRTKRFITEILCEDHLAAISYRCEVSNTAEMDASLFSPDRSINHECFGFQSIQLENNNLENFPTLEALRTPLIGHLIKRFNSKYLVRLAVVQKPADYDLLQSSSN